MAIDYSLLAVGGSLLALIYAIVLIFNVRSQNAGTARMQEIAAAVREGANAFLSREYKVITPVAILIAAAVYGLIDIPLATGGSIAVGFVLGAVLSAFAGYVGMAITVRTSSRTAEAAKKGLGDALTVAFRGGSVMGFAVVGFGLLGLSLFYIAYQGTITANPATMAGLGFGASLIAMFMRVSGGIYTKAADVGADLVGKVEANIPEDDPRNPAVIADNVGDNVGDCAGMGADVYESFVVTAIAAIILAALIGSPANLAAIPSANQLLVLPILLGAAGIIGSILGGLYIRRSIKRDPLGALNVALIISAVIAIILDFVFTNTLFGSNKLGYYLF